jgi:hypothetical protein
MYKGISVLRDTKAALGFESTPLRARAPRLPAGQQAPRREPEAAQEGAAYPNFGESLGRQRNEEEPAPAVRDPGASPAP